MKKLLAVGLIGVSLIGAASSNGKKCKKKKKKQCCAAMAAQQENKFENELDSVSYSLGHVFAKQSMDLLQRSNESVDSLDKKKIIQGFADAINKTDTLFSEEELRAIVGAYAQKKQAEVEAKRQAESAVQKQASKAFLEQNKLKPGVVTLPSGLQYEVLKAVEEGQKPTAASTVTVHYHGTTIDGKVFDSSVDRGQPATFALNRVIRGWTEGVQLMSVGSKYKFYIPSDLAYGDNGAGSMIGPGAALIFEVELISIAEEK